MGFDMAHVESILGVVAMKYVIEIPRIPPSELRGNSRSHWAKKARSTKEWKEIGFGDGRQLLGTRNFKPIERARLTYEFIKKGRIDIDNFSIALKPFVDGLVTSGLFPDDDSKHITYGEHVVTQAKGENVQEIIFVEIEELPCEREMEKLR